MRNRHFALLALALLLSGCGGDKKAKTAAETAPAEEPLPERFEHDDLPKAADELFEDFVYYFASNEQLQRRRIAFPLEEKTGGTTIVHEREDWRMEPFFMSAGEYTLIFDTPQQRELVNDTTIDAATVEKIYLNADSVRQYLFCRTDGRWMLEGIRTEHLSANANAAFLTFYRQFASDSAFQMNSLSEEIAFSGPDPEDDFAQMEGFITPDSWGAFAPDLPQDSIYNIVYGKQKGQSKEKFFIICGISNGQEMELTFRKKRGMWKLAKLTE